MRHETLVFQQDLRRWAQRCRSLAALDFHAPGASENSGTYAFLRSSDNFPQVATQATNWAKVFAQALGPELAAQRFIRSADYPSRWNTSSFGAFCQDELRTPALCVETPYTMIGQAVLTRRDYQAAGRLIADVIAHRAQHTD
jgi:hypothetical protein